LSVFPSEGDPHRTKGGGDAPKGSSTPSIEELWPNIGKLDEINHGATFVGDFLGATLCERRSSPSIARVNEHFSSANKRVLMDDAPGSSSGLPRCRGRGRDSVRKKATQILAAAPGVILPRMRRSFVDRQYSPSTGMDQNEWEIILEEYTCMG
jgi:hypothetical protein